jgi:hypothetical protein
MTRLPHSIIALLIAFLTAHAEATPTDLAVYFTSPTNGQTINGPIVLQVNVTKSSNSIATVEYFVDGESIGIRNALGYPSDTGGGPMIVPQSVIIITLPPPVGISPFDLNWEPVPGNYVLTAQVTDNQGNTALSDPVNVTVVPMTFVTVETTEQVASRDGQGIFTIERTGATNEDLHVLYFLGGTAQNGVGFAQVPVEVIIPAGQFSADVVIDPLVFAPGKTTFVTLTVMPPPFTFSSPLYKVGSPLQATVYIRASERNGHKPSIRFIKTIQTFPGSPGILLTVDTFDRDTYVTKVEFFDGSTKMGEVLSTAAMPPGAHETFNFIWTNASAGTHVLRARVTDSQNGTALSPRWRTLVPE